MKVKEYIEANKGLWNILGNITYEITKDNKAVNIYDHESNTCLQWSEEYQTKSKIENIIKNIRTYRKENNK
jgi:hypothetical protein|tara:strand:+ start:1159 stop:1371 length:213 start_codon:yes stop_codon:yes gene_type:complete